MSELKKIYVYLISSGAYSDYTVERVALHMRKFNEAELNGIAEEMNRQVKPDWDGRNLDADKVDEVLKQHGFIIKYPVGELNEDTISTPKRGKDGYVIYVFRYTVSLPWSETEDREASALREGLG